MSKEESVANMQLETEETVEKRMDLQLLDPEQQKMQDMTETEALMHLGMEKTQVYKNLDQILSERNSWARRIVNFLQTEYPEQMPLMVCNGKLEKLLDQRIAQATEQYDTMQRNLQEKMNVQNLDFRERVLTEERIREQIMEVISREILYKPLNF